MPARSFILWMCAKKVNSPLVMLSAPCTWVKAPSNETLRKRFLTRAPKLFSTVEAVSVPHSPLTISKRWVTPTWNPWTADSAAGKPRACPSPKRRSHLPTVSLQQSRSFPRTTFQNDASFPDFTTHQGWRATAVGVRPQLLRAGGMAIIGVNNPPTARHGVPFEYRDSQAAPLGINFAALFRRPARNVFSRLCHARHHCERLAAPNFFHRLRRRQPLLCALRIYPGLHLRRCAYRTRGILARTLCPRLSGIFIFIAF